MARLFSAVLGASGALWVFSRRRARAAELEDEPKVRSTWDFNWDRRSPESMRKPEKKVTDDEKQQDKPTASRHLLFIRHGQYDQTSTDDKLRSLTELGRYQAALTGQRLKAFSKPYTRLITSTLTRARETTNIICESLCDVPVETCDMLVEGAPCRPEPPISHWKPEHHVSL
jgi:serine/threonine-protein phosphatase PGAM5